MNGELTVQYGTEEEKKSEVIMKREDSSIQQWESPLSHLQ